MVNALVPGTPYFGNALIIKQDGTREEFDRNKLLQGIRIARGKRPVAAADIERLLGEIESTLQRMGKSEVASRVVSGGWPSLVKKS